MPRVLFLTCHLPFPPMSGGRLREYELLRRLGDDFEVHLFVVTKTYREDAEHVGRFSGLCERVSLFPAEPDAAANGLPAQVARHASLAASAAVREAIEEIDLVHVEGFYLMQHIPDPCPIPVLLAEQNVEYLLSGQRADVASDEAARLALTREVRRTRAAEHDAWRRADWLAVLTGEDRAVVEAAGLGQSVGLVPDGADHVPLSEAPPERARDCPTAVFVGNFAYEPNLDAARFLTERIWPLVTSAVPGAELLLVGNDPPEELRAAAGDGITVTGRVPDVEPYLDEASVVVAPLRIGGGVKVKVLEALRRGKAIVTTPVGAQGFGPACGRCMRVSDAPASFAHAVVDLLESREERTQLQREALRLAGRLPTWDASARTLGATYRTLLGTRARRAA